MDFRWTAVLAALAASMLTGTSSRAQAPGPTGNFDPPETVYQTGAMDEDPIIERKRAIIARHRAFLPVAVDLSSRMPPVGNQGHLASCTAWATAYAARSYYTNALENRNIRQPANLPSPNYIFHISRPAECEKGSTVGRAVDVLRNGALSLAEYPHSDSCVPQASADLVGRASDFKVRGLTRVDSNQPDDIKGQLSRANPVIISFRMSTAWAKLRGPSVFNELLVPADDRMQGGHAMTIVGYDDQRQAFRVMNSWGERWGDRGFGWMSYDVLPTRLKGAWVLDVGAAEPRPAPLPIPVPVPAPAPAPAPVPVAPAQLAELNTLSCARVDAELRGNQSIVSGYVASDDDLNRVKSIAANVPGTSVGNVIVAPWPQCEALQTLDKPLRIADRPAINIGGATELHGGDPLRIEVRSPAHISYLYVSYIQADGSVVHLVQPRGPVPQPTLPRQTLKFGGGEDGKPKFTVGPPFGREMIIAIASRSPLFEQELPAQQTEREYLTGLRRALIYKPAPDMPDRELSATMITLQTSAR